VLVRVVLALAALVLAALVLVGLVLVPAVLVMVTGWGPMMPAAGLLYECYLRSSVFPFAGSRCCWTRRETQLYHSRCSVLPM
jgi:hypothetical protein